MVYQLNGESDKLQFTKGARMLLSPDFPKFITPEEALKEGTFMLSPLAERQRQHGNSTS